jgi:hypothetical protein
MEEYEKTIAQTYELRKGISTAIQVTMDSAANLYFAIANPQSIEVIQTISASDIRKAYDTALRARTNEQRKTALDKYRQLQQEKESEGDVIVPKISKSAYAEFISNFYGLWLATAIHIKSNDWRHSERKKSEMDGKQIEIPTTKEHIQWLFNEYLSQKPHPRLSLELFEDYIYSLYKSGIYDLSVMEVPE